MTKIGKAQGLWCYMK